MSELIETDRLARHVPKILSNFFITYQKVIYRNPVYAVNRLHKYVEKEGGTQRMTTRVSFYFNVLN